MNEKNSMFIIKWLTFHHCPFIHYFDLYSVEQGNAK